jgi:Hydrophobic surface binding protein A
MRFGAILSLAVLGLASAFPTEQATLDAAPITNGFNAISAALDKFTADLAGVSITSDPKATTAKLKAGSASILAAMTEATKNVKAMAPAALADALALPNLASKLVTKSKDTVNALISKKAIIAAAGQTAEVVKELTEQKAAATAFGDAVASKLPSVVQSIAKQQGGQAAAVIQDGITAFSS